MLEDNRMRLLLVAVLLAMLAGCATHAGRLGDAGPPSARASAWTVASDITYSPQDWPERLLADVYVPQGAGPFPGVLMITGGGWQRADRRVMRPPAEALANRGYVVVVADYRTAPQYHFPAPLDDLREALRYMRAHAAELHLDASRVAAFGYSAGGHLAALLAGMDAPPELRVGAAVVGGAPSDLRKFEDGRRVPQFLGGSQAQVPEQFRLASPIVHVTPDDPPVFLFHGGLDNLVPVEHAQDYYAALRAAGVPAQFYRMPRQGHLTGPYAGRSAVSAAIDFLDRVLRQTSSD